MKAKKSGNELDFGVRLPNSGPKASRQNITQVARATEDLGFHSIWVHDHIVWGSEQHRTHISAGSAEALNNAQTPNFFESITTLAYLAGMTRRVKLGIAVLVLPLRNPVVVAKELANLDVLSEGRLMVGVAPGASKITHQEFKAVGVSYEERGKITDDYLVAIRKLWNEDLPSHHGKYSEFDQVQMFPKPFQKNLKIFVGGGERGISERALRRVLELGDGWIPAYLTADEARDGISKVKHAAQDSGRSPDDFFFAHEMFTLINESAESARELARESLLTNFSSFEEGLKRSLVGDPEEIADKLEGYEKSGVNLTELKFIYRDVSALEKMLELFAKEVLPKFTTALR
jgi:probable F420-dependent oxidoreductase